MICGHGRRDHTVGSVVTQVDSGTMLSRLYWATGAARHRMERLEPLLTEPESAGPSTGTIGRHAPESSEPWAAQAAAAYFDLYFGAREMARAMRGVMKIRRPTGDEACGSAGLAIVENMAPSVPDFMLRGVTRMLEKLVRQADQVPAIDEDEPWVPLPRLAGRQIACPYCDTYGLRMLVRRGDVRCFFPDCTDADGKPTRARMEPGRMTGEARLIFGDGTMMGGGA
jgi:hypothetical protein